MENKIKFIKILVLIVGVSSAVILLFGDLKENEKLISLGVVNCSLIISGILGFIERKVRIKS